MTDATNLIEALELAAAKRRAKLQAIYVERLIDEVSLLYCRKGEHAFSEHEIFQRQDPPDYVKATIRKRAAELNAEVHAAALKRITETHPELKPIVEAAASEETAKDETGKATTTVAQ